MIVKNNNVTVALPLMIAHVVKKVIVIAPIAIIVLNMKPNQIYPRIIKIIKINKSI